MKRITASVTERGQVTIPAEVRRKLGLKPRDKVDFVMEEGTVELQPRRFTLESAYGSIPAKHDPDELLELSERAKDAKARDAARELRGE